MKRVAKFHKISYEQFVKDMQLCMGEKIDIKATYDAITLPKRATKNSAGYDFHIPFSITIQPNESLLIPTGIRVEMKEGWVLKLYPRSSFGFQYRMQLNNTVGIIDQDYFYSDNEGHIMAKITNDSNEGKTLCLSQNERFMQGIFVEYGICFDDEVEEIRNGGIGSTGTK